jgi:GNAT superfamily N-acetyltransferase
MDTPTLFESNDHYGRELVAAEVPRLQGLFDENPEYSLAVNGRQPLANEAQLEFDERPPAEFGYTRRWFIGLFDPAHALIGHAGVISDLLAERVWHIGLFIVATRLHGQGVAQGLYAALEDWIRRAGADWLRLGVVDGNTRAERFRARNGFVQVRVRGGYDTGGRINDVRVLVKALGDEPLDSYLARVSRDRPDSVLP